MVRGRRFAAVALAVVCTLTLAGCSGKVRLSMQKHCESVGGTWSQATETCNPGAGAARQAKQMCESNGGVYLPGGMCEYEGTK